MHDWLATLSVVGPPHSLLNSKNQEKQSIITNFSWHLKVGIRIRGFKNEWKNINLFKSGEFAVGSCLSPIPPTPLNNPNACIERQVSYEQVPAPPPPPFPLIIYKLQKKVTGKNVTALIMLRKGKYPMEPWDLKVKTRMRKLPKGRENPNDQAVTDFVFE